MISVSDTEASREQTRLSISIDELLQSNRDLNKRMLQFECRLPSIEDDASVAASSHGTIEHRPASVFESGRDLISDFSFEEDLENSRVYRQVYRTSVDYSFRSSVARSHAWTLLSLQHVSLLSVIALPLNRSEISNAGHYPLTYDNDTLPKWSSVMPPEHSGCTQVSISISVDDNSSADYSVDDQVSSSDHIAQDVGLLESLALQSGSKTKVPGVEQLGFHLADEVTSWLDIDLTSSGSSYSLVQFNRLADLRTYSHSQHSTWLHLKTQCPRLVAFMGETCVGKSTLIRSLVQIGGSMVGKLNAPQPVVGPIGEVWPTSTGIHLYANPAIHTIFQPLLYADCQGTNDQFILPLGSYCKKRDVKIAITTRQASNHNKNSKAAARALDVLNTLQAPRYMTSELINTDELGDISHLYSMLMYTTADIVVFVTSRYVALDASLQ
jgi:hypothetical protein